ncbi:tail fiber domain-containing protein [Burkholderia ubonensis]|uniref:tail fiber domain-containing protein n=1 Tax=Burkholderia ubonensis TaxID=101571 RepID=UPI0009B556CC|nr:tail fiber domain-containing protein [Burkholderia ubonensis]
MTWYTTGTVAMTNGSADVIATGAQFITNTKPGDIFVVLTDGMIYEIDEIVSATQLKLKRAYAGSTGDGLQYEVVPTASYLKTLATQVSDLIALYTNVPAEVAASASAAADSAKAAAADASAAASSASDAAASKAAAAASATNAANAAAAATASKEAAATSEANTASSVSAATSKASDAAASAAAAETSATKAASSATAAASSATAAAKSEQNVAAAITGTLKDTNNLSDVADKAAARVNLDVPGNAALNAVRDAKVSKTGDTIEGVVRVMGKTAYELQFQCTDAGAPSGLWRIWGGAGGAINVMRNTAAAGDFSTITTPFLIDREDVARFSVRPTWAGTTPWDSGNFDPNYKLNRGGDSMWGRLTLDAPNWQADLALSDRSPNGGSWTYIRARHGGGLDVINSAYNAIPFAIDDWGNVFLRGLHVMQTNGNLFCQYRNAWMSDILNDLYSRDDSKIDWGNANDRWNQTVQRDPANVHRYWWDGGNRRVIISIDGQSVAYVASNLSDMRLKTNIAATREDSLSKVNAIKFKEFDWRDSGKHQRLGVIAQQAKLLDESFVYQPPGDPLDPTKSPMMLDANSMLLTALHAIQQLSAKVDDLERRLAPSTS